MGQSTNQPKKSFINYERDLALADLVLLVFVFFELEAL